MPGTPSEPAWTMTVGGSPFDLRNGALQLRSLIVYSRDSDSRLTWQWFPRAFPPRESDPFRGKLIELSYDVGAGAVLIFRGRCMGAQWSSTPLGWGQTYSAQGLRYTLDLSPVTNTNTGGDTHIWNADPEDWINYRIDRAARTVGRIYWSFLHDQAIASAMLAAGVGGYGSTPMPAEGRANLLAGAVSTIDVTNQGDGFGTTPPNVVIFGGGGTGATATAVLTAGKVTSITVTNGGSGYTSPPEVWIAPFAASTLGDLARMTVVPPFMVSIAGDRLAQSMAATLKTIAPNHAMFVLAGGALRLLDQRQFGSGVDGYPSPITLTLDDPADRVDVESMSGMGDTEGCYTQVCVRGDDYAEMRLYQTDPINPSGGSGSIQEFFGHSGLTSDEARGQWRLSDFDQPDVFAGTASATCSISGGGITNTFTIVRPGFGYPAGSPPTITFSGGGGTGAAATATLGSGGRVVNITRTSAGTGYISAPTMAFTPPPTGSTADVGTCTCIDTLTVAVDPADNLKSWPLNFWDQTVSGGKGIIFLSVTGGGGINSSLSRRIVANAGLSAGGTSAVTLDRAIPNLLFDRYWIRGIGYGPSIVWRRYRVVDPDLRARLRPRAAYPAPLINANGNAAAMTATPVVELLYEVSPGVFITNTIAATFDYAAGTFDTERPVVAVRGTEANLRIGGASTDGIPTIVRAYIPTRTTPLQAFAPRDTLGAEIHGGTANSLDGIVRTLTVTVPSWRDPGNLANMRRYADDLHDSVKDVVFEGSLAVLRFDPRWFTPGQGVRIAGNGYTTGFESSTLPVVETELRWTQGATRYQTVIRYSNRRAAFSAAQYERPQQVPFTFGT